MTPEDKIWFEEYLSEGIHTAFRKGSDHPTAGKIWTLIRELPPAQWGSIVNFVSEAMLNGIEYREKKNVLRYEVRHEDEVWDNELRIYVANCGTSDIAKQVADALNRGTVS